MGIDLATTADQTADLVRAMIVDGVLKDGERVNEVHLAAAIGVSRTPLREALNRLAAEGAVEARPNRGVFVCPLTVEDFLGVYGVRPILDPEALRLSGVPSAETVKRLAHVNGRMRAARDPHEAMALDDEWHLLLVAGCPNRVLLDLIRQMMRRTRRYETALFRETSSVFVAGDEHDRIVEALGRGDLDRAIALLKQNLETGAEPILQWLKRRNAGTRGAGT